MALTRRAFVRTLGAGGAGLMSGALVGARGHEALAAGRGLPSPAAGERLIRLDSNENPRGPGQAVLDAVRAGFDDASRYPHRFGRALPEEIARVHGIDPSHVLVGIGSGEILKIAVMAFVSPTKSLVTALPTFESPTRTAQAMKYPVHEVPVDGKLQLDLATMADKARDAGLVFFCNPNNPTGTVYGASQANDFIGKVLKASPDAIVLVDEAYHEYVHDPGYRTAVPLAMENPRVVVSRTFSKVFGMAGLRIGYAIGHPETLAKMAFWKLDQGLNMLGMHAARAAVGATGHIEREVALNHEAREFTRRAFADMGYPLPESHANFVMVDIKRDVVEFGKACRDHGIAVGRAFPPLVTSARVSMGTMDEMRQAVDVFGKVLGVRAATAAAR